MIYFVHGVDPVMAMDATDPPVDVHRMREAHRLNRLVTHARVFRREIIPHSRRDSAAAQQQNRDDYQREPVRPPGEDVRHFKIVVYSAESLVWLTCARAAAASRALD